MKCTYQSQEAVERLKKSLAHSEAETENHKHALRDTEKALGEKKCSMKSFLKGTEAQD